MFELFAKLTHTKGGRVKFYPLCSQLYEVVTLKHIVIYAHTLSHFSGPRRCPPPGHFIIFVTMWLKKLYGYVCSNALQLGN